MKIRFCAALLLAALAISVFAGCAAAQPLDSMRNTAQNRPDRAEDALESQINTAASMTSTPAVQPQGTQSVVLLTEEEAKKIALEHAGFTADQVQRLRTELDYDRGRAEYEVDFHVGNYEYDYEIDAETGKIISYDKDLDD